MLLVFRKSDDQCIGYIKGKTRSPKGISYIIVSKVIPDPRSKDVLIKQDDLTVGYTIKVQGGQL